MGTFRVKKTTDYSVMSNHHFRNKNLSLKAKGLLSLMLSLPDDWSYTMEGLATMNTDGIDSIRTAIRELEAEGYVIVSRERDEGGRLGGTVYDVYEQPILEKPILEKPILGKPILENPRLLNTNKLNTNKLNTNTLNNNKGHFKKPTIEEIEAYIHEKNLSVNAETFFDFYESKGWLIGKSKMKDYKAALRNWERRNNAVRGNKKAAARNDNASEEIPVGWDVIFGE